MMKQQTHDKDSGLPESINAGIKSVQIQKKLTQ